MSELIQDIPRDKIRGKFNKDLLLNSFFEHTELFSPAANTFTKTGKYCGELFNSKKYNVFWDQERDRCINGYVNPVSKLWIPGKYYFFLNYKQMSIIPEDQRHLKKAKRITTFPRFWPIHYFFLQDYILAKDEGLNLVVLKPRDTGFSELFSSIGVHEYTFQTEDPVFYFVAVERYLNKDGVLSKAWDQLDFLNAKTERAFKHLRQYKDQDLHKRASYFDSEAGGQVKTGGEIQGAVVDHPRKLRGARGFVNFEEFGSFPNGEDAWMTAVDLAQHQGVAFAMMCAWGCFTENNMVWTHDGRYISLKDLKQEDGVIGYNGKTFTKEPIIWLKPPAQKPCYRITLETGITIECSDDHPLLWTNEDFKAKSGKPRKVKFLRADKTNIGDSLCVIDEVPIFGTQVMEDARLIGLLIGDGNYSKGGSVELCGCDKEILDFIEQNYNYNEKKEQYNKSDGRLFKSYNIRGIIPTLKELGIFGQTKTDKRLPLNIHKYNKDSIAQLLGGYFDADGYVKQDGKRGVSIILTSICKQLLEQVRWQLYKFGIHCNIIEENPKGGFGDKKDERHKIHRLYITRYTSVLNFQKNIKFLCKHKQDVLNSSLIENRKVIKNLSNAEFIFDESTGKGAYFIGKKDLSGSQLYRIVKKEFIGTQTIYNLNAGETHTYLANNVISANTGGEQGPGIAGLEKIFLNPNLFDCLPFENCWETDGILPHDHGFFFPSWANVTKFMDKNGNTDFVKAKAYRDEEREKLSKVSQTLKDKRVSQQPYCPSEGLMRLQDNPFPIEQLNKQLRKIDSSPEIHGILKHGELEIDEGKVKFKLNSKLEPVDRYPHKTDGILEGAFTMFEAPLKDEHDKIPASLYYIVADCFAVDTEQATDWNSLGSFYVYKKTNTMFPTEDDILVGWYHGRPPRVKDFHRRVFLAARFYNAVVQTEIKGGGQELLNYAKDHGFLEYCGERPTVFNQDKEFKKMSGRQFFVRIEENTKPERIQKLVDWLLKERNLKIEGDKTEYVLNLERIYDRGLLEELIKYNPNGNFDRISCLLVLMTIQQEAELQQVVEANKRDRDHIFNRQLFTDNSSHSQYMLSEREMKVDGRNNDLII